MKSIVFVIAAAAGAAGCGSGTTPVAFCNEFQVALCARVFDCTDAATQATADFQMSWGASVTECDGKLEAMSCATATNDQPCGTTSLSFHAGKADACVADLKAAPCSSIQNGFTSDNCSAVCS